MHLHSYLPYIHLASFWCINTSPPICRIQQQPASNHDQNQSSGRRPGSEDWIERLATAQAAAKGVKWQETKIWGWIGGGKLATANEGFIWFWHTTVSKQIYFLLKHSKTNVQHILDLLQAYVVLNAGVSNRVCHFAVSRRTTPWSTCNTPPLYPKRGTWSTYIPLLTRLSAPVSWLQRGEYFDCLRFNSLKQVTFNWRSCEVEIDNELTFRYATTASYASLPSLVIPKMICINNLSHAPYFKHRSNTRWTDYHEEVWC